ncbi:multicopper oxidase domain-containing protein [Thiorhodococcus mannitoliphagus]|uniref:Multicopper oxidase domain-containing protein n=1 Tax=Thiorhodococcus mannitoliphagus TaxID=329406 RepID=A0A6P1DTE8_9GAMM|nr:multicopper oxidase domain-containing protein [Thiorhodococcus mannitoliphagus]NEX18954.1 multicopper oxidase domain-containing protein [Thiorhodococcus mannitoliphagus]
MNELLRKNALSAAVTMALMGGIGMGGMGAAQAAVNVQCAEDDDHDGIPPADIYGNPLDLDDTDQEHVKCMHLTSGDGFAEMSDGHPAYTFGFADETGTDPSVVLTEGILAARWPGPRIVLEQGDEFYLSLSNVGTVMRPDLFDPHTVHYHGFPNAATVFDGVPEVSIAINMGSTLTYYYNVVEPGTFIYHCHVEATEHMEMGMLANLYVHPLQDRIGIGGTEGAPNLATAAPRFGGSGPTGYAYNDGDGTTAYDVEAPIQVSGFDSNFHDAHIQVQPLPFANLRTNYPQINGRGYPDTVLDDVNTPADQVVMHPPRDTDGFLGEGAGTVLNNGDVSQDMGAGISVAAGGRVLLRLSNVSIDRFFTLTAPGLKMQIVGTGARLARGVDGKNLYVDTTSVNFGGGETHDVIIDTAGVAPGTYFLTAAEFYQMSNNTQLDGGLITEIVVN